MTGLQGINQRHSWLSLVAETAGVSGATVARIEIAADWAAAQAKAEWVRAVIQIQDDFGSVVGAVGWEGSARELAEGVTVDVGFDLSDGYGTRVVGWIQSGGGSIDPARALAPLHARSRTFDPSKATQLILQKPVQPTISARSASPRAAA